MEVQKTRVCGIPYELYQDLFESFQIILNVGSGETSVKNMLVSFSRKSLGLSEDIYQKLLRTREPDPPKDAYILIYHYMTLFWSFLA